MIKEIPSTVIVPQELADTESEMRKDIRRMQAAYASLRDLQDYICPTSIDELTTDEIDRLTDERTAKVMADTTLLPTEKAERIKIYKRLHRFVALNVNMVNKILQKWPGCNFVYDEAVRNIVPTTDLHTVAEALSVRDVPKIVQKHADLINSVMAKISALREFERTESVTKVRLEILAQWDAETLAAKWANGDILRPAVSPDAYLQGLEYRREIFEKTYL